MGESALNALKEKPPSNEGSTTPVFRKNRLLSMISDLCQLVF
jgi:hypothetical protein